MHKKRVLITMGCCLFAMTFFAGAQAVRKPGLWEMTTNMTWQQSPMPQGMTMPGSGQHTTLVCLTQQMIDKYGIPIGAGQGCKIINVVLKATSMTGEMVCTGRMAGKATLQSSWGDSITAKGSSHFVGTMQMGQRSGPIEYTTQTTSTYKGPDCGGVAPMPMPQE
jgi:hypothetical protein